MGKRMQQETRGRISKVELPIPLPRSPDGSQASESVLGMLVRALAGSLSVQEILLLTSTNWVSAHSELAAELARRYKIDVRCKCDNSSGDEFPPHALAALTEEIGQQIDLGRALILLNGDILFGIQGLHSFMTSVRDSLPLIATGVADVPQYLGIYFLSPDLDWRRLTREIAAKNIIELISGLWERVPVLSVKIDSPIYDCGSVEGYRLACEDGRAGKLW